MVVFVAVVFLISSFFLCKSTTRLKLSYGGLLISLQFLFQYLLVEFDYGSASLRIYTLYGLTALSLIIYSVEHRHLLPRVPYAKAIMVTGLVLLIWSWLIPVARGAGINNVTYQFLSVNIYGFLFFFITQFYLRNISDILFFCCVCLMLVALNGLVAGAQWSGYDWSWSLFEVIRPDSAQRLQDPGKRALLGYIPGLQEYSIPLSYFMLFGLLSWTLLFTALARRNHLIASISFCILIITELGVVSSLSRSTLLIFHSLLFLSFLIQGKRYLPVRLYQRLFLVFSIFIILLFAYTLLYSSGEYLYSAQGFSTERLFSYRETGREDLWSAAFLAILGSPLFGIGLTAFADLVGYDMAPHNVFLNAGVNYGLPGILIITFQMVLIFRMLSYSLKLNLPISYSTAILQGFALIMVGYLIKGIFHNDSFATGGITGWFCLGVYTATLQCHLKSIENDRKSPQVR